MNTTNAKKKKKKKKKKKTSKTWGQRNQRASLMPPPSSPLAPEVDASLEQLDNHELAAAVRSVLGDFDDDLSSCIFYATDLGNFTGWLGVATETVTDLNEAARSSEQVPALSVAVKTVDLAISQLKRALIVAIWAAKDAQEASAAQSQ
jgi:hypothetical protein